MKRLLLTLTTAIALTCTPALFAKGKGKATTHRSATPKTKASKKSTVPGSKDGKYVGGKGSSHKGGHYTNSKTGNKERDRKDGVSK